MNILNTKIFYSQYASRYCVGLNVFNKQKCLELTILARETGGEFVPREKAKNFEEQFDGIAEFPNDQLAAMFVKKLSMMNLG